MSNSSLLSTNQQILQNHDDNLSSSSIKLCDGCGKPSHSEQALRRCSRCQSAWYHDAICQRRHFKQHKKTCLSIANSSSSALVTNKRFSKDKSELAQEKTSLSYRCETNNKRGRCMIANKDIQKGTRLESHCAENSENGNCFFTPIVPAVLFESQREKRCSICFQLLSDGVIHTLGSEHAMEKCHLIHLFCSKECVNESRTWNYKEEELAANKLHFMTKVQISPTILMLYRIIRKILMEKVHDKGRLDSSRQLVHEQISSLSSNVDCLSDDEKDYYHHIVEVTKQLLNFSPSVCHQNIAQKAIFSSEAMIRIVSQIMQNGFSIADGESVAIGLGIYPQCSIINHSCAPNVIQTFSYGVCKDRQFSLASGTKLPKLILTTCKDIGKDEELFIAYLDVFSIRHQRRKQLWKDYKFWCECIRCRMSESYIGQRKRTQLSDDDFIVGLCCPISSCNGYGMCLVEHEDCKGNYVCNTCGEEKFQSAIKERDRLFSTVKPFLRSSTSTIETKRKMGSKIKQLELAYKSLKRVCHLSSWYIQESGDALVQALLDEIESSTSESKTVELCTRSLSILRELVKGLHISFKSRNEMECSSLDINSHLPTLVKRYKAAKLELFLYPDPTSALMELQELYNHFLKYYPKYHEFIEGLELCMQNALMS